MANLVGSGKSSGPKHRRAVRDSQTRLVLDPTQPVVPLALHDPMDARDTDVVLLAVIDPAAHFLHRRIHVDRADPHAEYVDTSHVAASLACCYRGRAGSPARRK